MFAGKIIPPIIIAGAAESAFFVKNVVLGGARFALFGMVANSGIKIVVRKKEQRTHPFLNG
ncbi:MAG: hypothetical protein R6V14_08075 [Halanaerobiales bacterium]